MNNATTLPTPPTQAGYYEGDEFIPGTQIDLLEAFSKVLREKRYMVRENFTYDPSQQGKAAMVLEQLQVEVDNMRSGLTRWCKTHYGEAFVAWMHIKVIRVFVESVLRYGLPVDFTAVLYKVVSGKEVLLVNALDKKFGVNKGKEEEDVEDDEEYHDFVLTIAIERVEGEREIRTVGDKCEVPIFLLTVQYFAQVTDCVVGCVTMYVLENN